jgi:hypothetical protein
MTDGIRVGHQSVIRSVIVIYGVGVLASFILCSYEYASLLAYTVGIIYYSCRDYHVLLILIR